MRTGMVMAGFVLTLGPALGCGSDEAAGGLRQLGEGNGLVILEDGVIIVPDVIGDTSNDTNVDTIGPDTVDTVGPDGTDVTDTADAVDVEADVPPTQCDGDEACPATTCGVGRCVDGLCTTVPGNDGGACDDEDPCTTGDTCLGGTCSGAGALVCGDDDLCTEDSCTPGVGCAFVPKNCDDSNACTTDECKPAVGCLSSPVTCPTSDNPCEQPSCDTTLGCGFEPRDLNTACNDEDPCTNNDRCRNGSCAGDALDCDDGNACTADACLAGGCQNTVIAGCATDQECIGRLAGETCNDGNADTSGDMCVLGLCRGFTLTRIAGTTVQGQQGLVIVETSYGPDEWSAVFWTADTVFRNRFMLARITVPATPVQYTATQQERLIIGVRDGFAGDTDGRLWRFAGAAWTRANAWDAALGTSGRGGIYDIFTARDKNAQGTLGTRRLWVVGEDNEEEWIRYCVEVNGGVTCSTQEVDDFEDTSIPTALAGVPICAANGSCSSSALVVGADDWAGGDFYNDTYENLTGLADVWPVGRVPDEPAERTTQAAVGWVTGGTARFMVVGTNGYMVLRRADETWTNSLSLKDGQNTRSFNGAWEGSGLVAIAASRRVSSTTLAYELWTAPSDSNLESGSSWTVHELGRGPNVSAAGIYDVHGRANGEIRGVGGVRRSSGLVDWVDGAVWVRTP